MNERTVNSRSRHLAFAVMLAAFTATLLALGLIPRAALADDEDMDMDVVNRQALETLAASGQKVTKVSLGGTHSAAVTEDGSLWTWGENDHGQLGYETTARGDNLEPRRVPGLADVRDVSLGDDSNSAAVTTDGTLWTWGWNRSGNLGYETSNEDYNPAPRRVPGLAHVDDFCLGGSGGAAIIDGDLWTWGNNGNGQLGYETEFNEFGLPANSSTPRKVPGLVDVVDVSLGWMHSAAVTNNGILWTWGLNQYGELGYETIDETYNPKPQQVPGLAGVVEVSLNSEHSAAITSDGKLWTWGHNYYGECGYESEKWYENFEPKEVANLTDVRAISFGFAHGAALTADGSLWTWGWNGNGQLGYETMDVWHNPIPRRVELDDAVNISLGGEHSAAITSDGALWTWGWNRAGQLGNGSEDEQGHYIPTQVTIPKAFTLKSVEGGGRVETSVAASRQSYEKADAVVVATAWNYPDALSAGPLAALLDAPLLLTDKTLPNALGDEIARLGASEVYVVGGEGWVPDVELDALRNLPGVQTVKRIADKDRYKTSVAVYEAGCDPDIVGDVSWRSLATIASGLNSADAVAAGALAAEAASPILLTAGMLSPEVSGVLEGFENVNIIGGKSWISQSIEDDLKISGKDVARLSGDNRYQTSASIVGFMLDPANAAFFGGTLPTLSVVGVASGLQEKYPDALVAGPTVAKAHGVLMLVNPAEGAQDLSVVSGHASAMHDGCDRAYFFGGDNTIPFAVRAAICSMVDMA